MSNTYVQPGVSGAVTLQGGAGTAFLTGGVGTFGVRVEDLSNNIVVARTTAGIIEVGAGIYVAALTWPTVAGSYIVIWDNGAGVDVSDEDIFIVGYNAPTVLLPMSLEQLREHVGTDLPDAALQLLLTDATQEVIARFGDDSSKTVEFDGGGRFLRLLRPAVSITSVVELDSDRSVIATLSANDYATRHGGRLLERLVGGTNGAEWWGHFTTVQYVPVSEEVIRNRMIVDLVKLSVTYNGMIHAESVGDYSASGSVTPDAYMRERENILMQGSHRRGFRFL